MLNIDLVSMHFGGVAALSDVTLELVEGEVLGLIGPNGSGKTTLFNVVTGLYAPTGGRVRLSDRDITGAGPHTIIKAGLARTFQSPRIYQRMTVLENVRVAQFTLPQADAVAQQELAWHLIKETGLAERADMLAKNLPLPDQRRLELARALARSPRLLLLDEPAGGMTPAETQDMADLIATLAAPGRTLVVIEHKMDMITSLCRRICVLNFGRLIADGEPGEVLADPAVLEAYLGPSGVALDA